MEVIPPPDIPTDKMGVPLPEQPERVWQPVEKQQPESVEEAAVPPASAARPEMREVPPNVSLPQAKETPSHFISGMTVAGPQGLRPPPGGKPADR